MARSRRPASDCRRVPPPLTGVGGKGMNLRAAFEGCVGEAAEYLSLLDWGDRPGFAARPDELFPQSGERHELLGWMLAGIGCMHGLPCDTIDWLTTRALNCEGETPVPFDLCLRRAPGDGPASRLSNPNVTDPAAFVVLSVRVFRDEVIRQRVALLVGATWSSEQLADQHGKAAECRSGVASGPGHRDLAI